MADAVSSNTPPTHFYIDMSAQTNNVAQTNDVSQTNTAAQTVSTETAATSQGPQVSFDPSVQEAYQAAHQEESVFNTNSELAVSNESLQASLASNAETPELVDAINTYETYTTSTEEIENHVEDVISSTAKEANGAISELADAMGANIQTLEDITNNGNKVGEYKNSDGNLVTTYELPDGSVATVEQTYTGGLFGFFKKPSTTDYTISTYSDNSSQQHLTQQVSYSSQGDNTLFNLSTYDDNGRPEYSIYSEEGKGGLVSYTSITQYNNNGTAEVTHVNNSSYGKDENKSYYRTGNSGQSEGFHTSAYHYLTGGEMSKEEYIQING